MTYVTLFNKSNFCPKNQLWKNFTFRPIWIFAPKLKGIFEKFISKRIKYLNFRTKIRRIDKNHKIKQNPKTISVKFTKLKKKKKSQNSWNYVETITIWKLFPKIAFSMFGKIKIEKKNRKKEIEKKKMEIKEKSYNKTKIVTFTRSIK